jgi:hypothetical protein
MSTAVAMPCRKNAVEITRTFIENTSASQFLGKMKEFD